MTDQLAGRAAVRGPDACLPAEAAADEMQSSGVNTAVMQCLSCALNSAVGVRLGRASAVTMWRRAEVYDSPVRAIRARMSALRCFCSVMNVPPAIAPALRTEATT